MSPPAWGWPGRLMVALIVSADVPTRVGMARVNHILSGLLQRCPHPRGDGPVPRHSRPQGIPMSPPAWGWPAFPLVICAEALDVPTRVGMARTPPKNAPPTG